MPLRRPRPIALKTTKSHREFSYRQLTLARYVRVFFCLSFSSFDVFPLILKKYFDFFTGITVFRLH